MAGVLPRMASVANKASQDPGFLGGDQEKDTQLTWKGISSSGPVEEPTEQKARDAGGHSTKESSQGPTRPGCKPRNFQTPSQVHVSHGLTHS